MAITWDFKKDRIGTVKVDSYGKEFVFNVYRCNGLIVWLSETETTYQMQGFFADEQHLKNCLGLSKDYDKENIYKDYFKEFSLINCKEAEILFKNCNKAKWENDLIFKILKMPF